ncbi:glycine--tRNA ligase subunit beta [Halovulum sp. GXIMD14793]
MPDLLIELFSEEIPARMQARAAADLKKLVTNGLVEAGLTYGDAAAFATPRRLVLSVAELVGSSPTLREERKGPRVDAPEKALEGFLHSTGLSQDDLEQREDKKGAVWFAVVEKQGRPAAEIVAEVLEATIRTFPWPKSMRWGSGALRWVRPLQSILCILTDEEGAKVVPVEVDGIKAGDRTEGHRFMAPASIAVTSFEDYTEKLRKHHVILDGEERARIIWHDAEQLAFAQGLDLVEDKGLLAEVAGLVEWPVVLMGEIGADFLDLPPEVLQTSMKEHQKFFSVKNPKTGWIERYITVANRETSDNGATILAGNSKVLAARLADAKFFWENDLRTVERNGLTGMAKPLENVTFHAELGTQAERIERIAALAREIAPLVGAKPDQAAEAARIAKADLASEMVYEFPELQGIMGRYYAQKAGHDPAVAQACEMHWKPLGPSDEVPSEPVSVAVALADKIDTLTGFWAIDEKPTGSKDPYALRRAALGVVNLLLKNNFSVFIFQVVVNSAKIQIEQKIKQGSTFVSRGEERQKIKSYDEVDEKYSDWDIRISRKNFFAEGNLFEKDDIFTIKIERPATVASDLLSFFADRLKVHLRDEGIRHDVIDACFDLGGQDDLVLLVNRVKALQAFLGTEDGANLLAGYKRANNILQVEEKKDGVEYSLDPDPKLAEQAEETALYAALDTAEAAITPALEAEDFAAAMTAMAGLRAPIDGFFDQVTVNAENPIVRRNRLCLLHRIRAVMNRVAVFSSIEG